jgi:hypothetical protein
MSTQRLGAGPAHPAPKLVELGETEALGVLDHHHGGVRHVHPHLDHGGGHQHLDLAPGEGPHHGFLVRPLQPAVQQTDPHSGQRGRPLRGHLGGRLHVLELLRLGHQRVHDIGLPPLRHLPPNEIHHRPPLPRGPQQGLDGGAPRGLLADYRDVEIAAAVRARSVGWGWRLTRTSAA